MKILLAVDGSRHTRRVLSYVIDHDELFSVRNEFTALTVLPPFPPRVRQAAGRTMVDDYYAGEAHKVLDPVREQLGRSNIAAQAEWRVGPAGATIARVTLTGRFGLVVMGSHGHGALKNLPLGSVATQVLAQCTVPVLIVR